MTISKILTLSTCNPLDANPPQSEHGAVVINVQKGDMVELLTKDEKHCVQIFNPL